MCRVIRRAIDDHIAPGDTGQPRSQRLDGFDEGIIEQQRPRAGVVHDIFDLARGETEVQRDDRRPHQGRSLVDLQVAAAVLHEQSNTIAGRQTQFGQGAA